MRVLKKNERYSMAASWSSFTRTTVVSRNKKSSSLPKWFFDCSFKMDFASMLALEFCAFYMEVNSNINELSGEKLVKKVFVRVW